MYRDNVYYSPEAHKLTIVGEVELAEPDYSFYTLCIWKDKKGKKSKYYLATDSGCSCPAPFESYYDVKDLTGPLTAAQVKEEATSLWEESGRYMPDDFDELMASVK